MNTHRITRGGFTLSEMLVVLGILVVTAALAQPALRGALGDSRLRSAAKQVRAELAKTRLKAIESGIAQRFRYQLGKDRFEIAPTTRVTDGEQTAASDAAQDRSREDAPGKARRNDSPQDHFAQRDNFAERRDADGQADPSQQPVQQSLPDGVCFDELPGEPGRASARGEDGWSDPIVFYPNGHTENAHIRLKGERDAVVDVSLRGLTGVVTAGKPRHEGELR